MKTMLASPVITTLGQLLGYTLVQQLEITNHLFPNPKNRHVHAMAAACGSDAT